jgi:hypothetical protein
MIPQQNTSYNSPVGEQLKFAYASSQKYASSQIGDFVP